MFYVALSLASLFSIIYGIITILEEKRKGQLASPNSIYAALVVFQFAVPALLIGTGVGDFEFANEANTKYALEAMVFVILSLLSFQIGFSISRSKQLKTGNRFGQVSWRRSSMYRVAFCLMIVGWLVRFYVVASNAYFQMSRTEQGQLEGPFYAAIRMIEFFPMYAICMLAIYYWRPNTKIPKSFQLAFFISIALELLYWIPSGRKEPVFLTIILPIMIRYIRNGILPSRKAVITIISCFILIFPIAYIYRNIMENTGTSANIIETIAAVNEIAAGGGADRNKSTSEILFGRLSLLEPVCASIRLIDQEIWRPRLGEDYLNALLAFIPRYFWKDKPDLHYGNEFGHAAGYLSPNDSLTSISVTYFGEAYLNFGWLGIMSIMMIGFIFGELYHPLIRSARKETWILVYVIALPIVLYVGGTFSLYFGGLIKLLPFFYVIGRVMETGYLETNRYQSNVG